MPVREVRSDLSRTHCQCEWNPTYPEQGRSHPANVTELQSLLGAVQCYAKFVQNLPIVMHSLHDRLNAAVEWTVFVMEHLTNAKGCLVDDTHYDENRPLVLATDASSYGVGAVISHQRPDAVEKRIAFASRTLSAAERNYSQIEREALRIIYGVKKFHQYPMGRPFTIRTDHRPLTKIFGPKTAD